jgi:DNA-binding IclR family transcriptional regulator
MRKTEDRTITIQVLERAFALLDLLASHQEPVSLKVISEQSGLHPSTAHRILNDLTIGRYVDRPEPGSYRLGMRLLELGSLVRPGSTCATRRWRRCASCTSDAPAGEPVDAPGRRDRLRRAHLQERWECRSCGRSAAGRRCISPPSQAVPAQDDAQRVRAYAARTGLAGHTRNSITDLTSLERELSRVAQYGTARDDEELELGVRCMAAGILDDQGKLVAGLSISAPADRLEESWLERLRATAAQISSALGHRG